MEEDNKVTAEPVTPEPVVTAEPASAPPPVMNGGVFSGSIDNAAVPSDQAPAFASKSVVQDGLSLTKKLIIGGAALVVALGVGVATYFVVQNNDDKLIGDALRNMLRDNDARIEGELTVSNLNDDGDKVSVRFGMRALTDTAGRNNETHLDLYARPTIAGIEALDGSKEFGGSFYFSYVDGDLYMKADYLRMVQQVVAAISPDGANVAWPEEITRFNDRWLMISGQTTNSFMGSENDYAQVCLQNQMESLKGDRQAGYEIFEMLTTIIHFEREGRQSGVVTFNVTPSITLADYQAFLEKVRDSNVIRGFVGCADNFQDGLSGGFYDTVTDAINAFGEMTASERAEVENTLQEVVDEMPAITLDINARTRRFTRLTAKGSLGDVDIDVVLRFDSRHYANANINAPVAEIELTESDLNTLGELDINQILNAGAAAAQRGAADRVLEALDAFRAEHNGVLPLLAIDITNGLVDEEDDFFADYVLMRGGFPYNLRLLNSANRTAFPDSYMAMTYSRPFFLQDFVAGRANSIRYVRYGASSDDIWLVYGATCREDMSSVVERAQGRTAAILTYLGNGLYYCID
jgi:hypothetical protein